MTVRRHRRWGVIALAIAMYLACEACRGHGATSGMRRIRASGVLRWGGDLQGGEPYVYEDPSQPGRIIGFEVDIANTLAHELGVRAEFHQNDWSALVPSLERGTFDVILNGLEVTPARAARVRFSTPYYHFAERLMARTGDRSIRPDLHALQGRRVGTLAGSMAYELLTGRADIVSYEGVEEPYIDLSNHRTDAVLLDDIISERYGQPRADLTVVGDVADGYYAVGIRHDDPDVQTAVDAALARIIARGELHAILSRARLWNDRQRVLTTWTHAQQRAIEGGAHPALARMDGHHVVLFLQGAGVTLVLSTMAMALAIPLGILLALMRLYGPPLARTAAIAYIELYRGTPVLLQLYVIYYGLAGLVRLGAFSAAILGLGMNYAAYEAEVYRAGIQAVPRGQTEAGLALGMSLPLTLRRVVLPQALRIALPSVTNDFIALLKDTSLVSVITVVELTKQMTITAVDTRSWLLPGALCALMYFVMSYPLSRMAQRLEARLARS